jgi:hypothetical protein
MSLPHLDSGCRHERSDPLVVKEYCVGHDVKPQYLRLNTCGCSKSHLATFNVTRFGLPCEKLGRSIALRPAQTHAETSSIMLETNLSLDIWRDSASTSYRMQVLYGVAVLSSLFSRELQNGRPVTAEIWCCAATLSNIERARRHEGTEIPKCNVTIPTTISQKYPLPCRLVELARLMDPLWPFSFNQ